MAHATKPTPTHREQVLLECIASAQRWQRQPGRNLVLLFDGTGNVLGNDADTNVVKLLRMLRKDEHQIVYYDPGVGTTNEFPADGLGATIRGFLRRLKGLALGSGAFPNIAEGYEFLVRHYRDGDRIFLFGFSRGAFTARAVGGMVNMYGLVQEQGLPLLPTMVRNYFADKDARNNAGNPREKFAADVVKHFSLRRTPLVHFVGVWDTVETIGSGFLGGVTITNSKDFESKRFVHVRHALSLHETRGKYTPRRYIAPEFTAEESKYRSFDERWFRGVHSDVGGSYKEAGLSNITLRWMVDEALRDGGLLFGSLAVGEGNPQEALHDQTRDCPLWVWVGIAARERQDGDTLDSSARPVDAATPAHQRPMSRLWLWVGVALTVLLLGVFTQAREANLQACTQAGLALPLHQAQLVVPWHTDMGISCDPAKLRKALLWDWFLLPCYALWMAYPLAWAMRRLVVPAIAQGRKLAWLPAHAHWFMLGLAGFDTVENLLSYRLAEGVGLVAWLIAVASSLKLASLLALVLILAAGAFAGKFAPKA